MAVLIATRNGTRVIGRVLDGYVKAQRDPGCTLCIVDNGSTDGTVDLVRSYADRLDIKLLQMPEPGKNRALNAALEQVSASFYIFSDDDSIPADDFLPAWRKTMQEQPDEALFGGTVTPLFPFKRPQWLIASAQHYPEMFAQNERPDGPIRAAQIFGPNMAVRASVFESGIRFNEDIGPSDQTNYAMGSETELCTRAEATLGVTSWFASGARVQHIVRANQMTQEFLAGRAYRHGRGVARMQLAGCRGWRRLRRLLKAQWNLTTLSMRIPRLPVEERQTALWTGYWLRGFIDEASSRQPQRDLCAGGRRQGR